MNMVTSSRCYCHFLLALALFLQISSSHVEATRAKVELLPGFEGPLPFELETGYVGLGETDDDMQVFYYFIKSENNPEKDPLMLWLSGGPGCSSFTGLAFQIGPIAFKIEEYNGSLPNLVLRPQSWTKVSSIIFADLPFGTGFSYAKNAAPYRSDWKLVHHVHQFLRKWLVDHPEFISNKFYFGGDSYSGIPAPAIVQEISNGNEKGLQPWINLQGYLLGNPMTTRREKNDRIPYVHGMGLISDELYLSLQRNCKGEYINVDCKNELCLRDMDYYSECLSRIDLENILGPYCGEYMLNVNDARHRRSLAQKLKAPLISSHLTDRVVPDTSCQVDYVYFLGSEWANDESVRKALHVRQGLGEWTRCYKTDFEYEIPSSFEIHVNLSAKGYPSLIYSGDYDGVVPFSSTQAWIRGLNYSIVDDWRPWLVNGQVAGYTRTYSNQMTFATVKGAGHVATVFKPDECLAMFTRYVGLGETDDDMQVFYFYIKSENNPEKDPLMLWLSGGPGCSSFSALAFQIGPIAFKIEEYNGSLPNLVLRPQSWTKVSSIIFADLPFGTGFSYAKNAAPYRSDWKLVHHVHQFLRKWLVDHPEFISNKFYFGGDSYSGIPAPAIVQEISNGNEKGLQPWINLQGYLLGNPLTTGREENDRIPYAHGMGLISDELYLSLLRNRKGEYINVDSKNELCLRDMEYYSECLSRIDLDNILGLYCGEDMLNVNDAKHRRSLAQKLKAPLIRSHLTDRVVPDTSCQVVYDYFLGNEWANDESVRKALHVRQGLGEWTRCYQTDFEFEISSSFEIHVNLSAKGYPSLIYSGDHDGVVPFSSTQAWIRGLNYSIVDDWRPWLVNGQVAGYTRTYSNQMTFATVKGAGHLATMFKPDECLVMFTRWLSNVPL